VSPLNARCVIVQGKGGVGRTTLAAALTLAAGERGRPSLAIELNHQHALASRLGAAGPTYDPQPVGPNAYASSLSAEDCMADFAQRKLRAGRLARWLLKAGPLSSLLATIPGLADVQQLGKVENLLMEPLDGDLPIRHVFLDAPATGHGLSLLGSAQSMATMTRVGPFFDLAQNIATFLSDPERTTSVLVTLPEALPVSETLNLWRTLVDQGRPPSAILVNQRRTPLPEGLQPAAVDAAFSPSGGAASDTLRKVALEALAHDADQRAALATLHEGLAASSAPPQVVALPRLADGTGPRALVPFLTPLFEVTHAR